MKTGLFFVLLSAILLPGCSRYRHRVNQEILERELRLQEDCVWQLKWQLEDQQRALDEARRQLETYKKEADTLRGGAAVGPDLTPPSTILAPAEGGRDSEAPRLPPAPPATGPLVEPGVEIAPPALPPVPSGPARSSGSGGSNPPRRRSDVTGPALTQATALSDEIPAHRPVDSSRTPERLNPDLTIDRIVLNEAISGGLDLDGRPGDELLGMAIEQRDERGAQIIAPGDVSIVVVDPSLDGRAAKIARWDFDADEVAKHVRRNRDGAALQFELPWPKQPQHSDLRLFVRFTTYDGRKLETNLPIEVQLPGSNGWKKSQVELANHVEADTESPAEPNVSEPEESASMESDNSAPIDPPPSGERRSKWSPNR